ncbi:hypothetical protein [Dankookia sp. P2]|uniref:HflX-like GTP-binding protein n=1 Tax=Dankookia sp. P2 TaxID=3423955 RepID=UPI003D6760F8
METKPPIPRAVLVGIQLPEVDDVSHAASLEELGRLVKTLGYEVVGSVSQRREGTGAGSLLGSGKLAELAAADRRQRPGRIYGAAAEIQGAPALRRRGRGGGAGRSGARGWPQAGIRHRRP